MKNNKPEIRFKGFNDDWEENTLGNVANRFDNLRIPITSNLRVSGSTPYYGANGIQDYVDGYTHEGEFILLAEDGANDLKNYPINYVNGKIWVNNHAHVIQAKDKVADNLFLKYTISKINIEPYLVGGGRAKLNAEVMMKLSLNLSQQLPEQTQIGTFFKHLDDLIALHQQRYDKQVVIKKAMLEKMFPRNGATVPEIRFKGFTDDWEEKTLGEVCVMGDIDHRMPPSVTDGIPYIMTGNFIGINGIDFENAKLISMEDYEQLAKKIKPEMGDILFARYASVGAVRYVETQIKFLVSYSCAILKQNNKFDSRYLFYYLQSQETQRQIELEINTGSQRNIGTDSMKKLIIFLPKGNEQQKIGTYFSNLDKLLTLHKQELAKLQNIKKALLAKMFV